MRNTFLSRLYPFSINLKLGLVLAVIALLLIGSAFTVFGAGGPPVITVIGVVPGSQVSLAIDNLPANDTFSVSMASGGSVGAGPVVAHFNTGAGGFETFTFEILTDVNSEKSITVRIDDGLGLTALATFDNTVAFSNPVLPTAMSTLNGTGTGATAVVPVTGGTETPTLAATTAATAATTATSAAGGTTPTVAATVAATSATTPTEAATVAATTVATSATTPTEAATVAATTAATSATTPTEAATVAATTATTPTPAAGGTTPTVAATTATTVATTPTVAATTAATPAPTTAGTTAATAVVPVTGGTPVPVATLSPTTGSIHVLHVEQGGWVQVQVDNMPLNTQFTAMVGPAGSQGFGGYQVGGLSSEDTSTHTSIFEIPILLRTDAALDLRLEAPGSLYLITFDNVNK